MDVFGALVGREGIIVDQLSDIYCLRINKQK